MTGACSAASTFTHLIQGYVLWENTEDPQEEAGRTGLGARRRGEERGWDMNMQDQREVGGQKTCEETILTRVDSTENCAVMVVQASLRASYKGCQATDRIPNSIGI